MSQADDDYFDNCEDEFDEDTFAHNHRHSYGRNKMATASPRLTTPVFRGSYCNLVTPRAVSEDDPDEKQYSMSVVLRKDDPAAVKFMKQFEKAVSAACIEKFGKDMPRSSLKHYPVKDADEDTNSEGEVLATANPEWEGCWIINAKNKRKPGAIDKAGNKLFSDDELYSGAWYMASLNVWAWAGKKFGKGVSVSLNNVLKDHDDDQFAGGASAEKDFESHINSDAEVGDDDEEEETPPPKKKAKKRDPLLG